MEFFFKQGKRNNRKTAKKRLPKRKNKAKSSQEKEATAVKTDGEYVIMRGAITPKEKIQKNRCKDVIGLTISKALNTIVENDGGQQVVYTKTDLSNDQKDGFITLTKNRELTTTGQGAYGEPIRKNIATTKEIVRNTNQGSKHKKIHRLATTNKEIFFPYERKDQPPGFVFLCVLDFDFRKEVWAAISKLVFLVLFGADSRTKPQHWSEFVVKLLCLYAQGKVGGFAAPSQ